MTVLYSTKLSRSSSTSEPCSSLIATARYASARRRDTLYAALPTVSVPLRLYCIAPAVTEQPSFAWSRMLWRLVVVILSFRFLYTR
jgi:hypothetical protein